MDLDRRRDARRKRTSPPLPFGLIRARQAWTRARFRSTRFRTAGGISAHGWLNDIMLGLGEPPRIVVRQKPRYDKVAHKLKGMGDYQPELIYEQVRRDARWTRAKRRIWRSCAEEINASPDIHLVTVRDDARSSGHRRLPAARRADRGAASDPAERRARGRRPVRQARVPALVCSPPRTNIGSLLCDGIGDAVLVQGEEAPGQASAPQHTMCLQAAGTRIFKTDYVACPSLRAHALQSSGNHGVDQIRAATSHLKGVKIAIMGCIVNGPGEMADADFGYVGGAPEQDQSLRRQDGGEVQHPRGRGGGPVDGFDPRARPLGGRAGTGASGVAAWIASSANRNSGRVGRRHAIFTFMRLTAPLDRSPAPIPFPSR